MTASDFTAPRVALEQCVRSTNATREKWGPRADPKGTEDLEKTRPRRIVFPPEMILGGERHKRHFPQLCGLEI